VMPISLIYMQRDALNADMNLNNRQLPSTRDIPNLCGVARQGLMNEIGSQISL